MSDTIAHNTGAAGAAPSTRSYFVREHHPENGSLLGFWLYLMSDCLIFACLFATYAVVGRSYADGPTGAALFDLPLVAVNTAMLLLSSITTVSPCWPCSQAIAQHPGLAGHQGLFGLAFLSLEMYEFIHLIHEGAGPQRSAFLSRSSRWSYPRLARDVRRDLARTLCPVEQAWPDPENGRRMMCLSLFWHFLDVIWIGASPLST